MDAVEQAVEAIFRVFQAEHWARFSYAVERDGAVFLDIPEDALAAVETDDAALAGFLRGLDGKPVDAETSKRAIGEHVFRTMEGVFPPDTVVQAFDSQAFGLTMQLFAAWVGGHEKLLDLEVLPLAEWQRMFAAWRQDPSVVRFAASLAAGEKPEPPADGTEH